MAESNLSTRPAATATSEHRRLALAISREIEALEDEWSRVAEESSIRPHDVHCLALNIESALGRLRALSDTSAFSERDVAGEPTGERRLLPRRR